jgi:hypothetical protein
MHGVLQRPAANAALVRRHGDQTEVRWRIKPPAQASRSRGGKTRRETGRRDLVEALAVIAALTVLTVVLYVHVRQGAIGL